MASKEPSRMEMDYPVEVRFPAGPVPPRRRHQPESLDDVESEQLDEVQQPWHRDITQER